MRPSVTRSSWTGFRRWLLLAVGCCAGLAAGCESTARYVDLDSKPTGAVIYVDGVRRGLTRSRVELGFEGGPGTRVLIQIVKPRYKPVLQYWTPGEVPENEKKVFVLEAE